MEAYLDTWTATRIIKLVCLIVMAICIIKMKGEKK